MPRGAGSMDYTAHEMSGAGRELIQLLAGQIHALFVRSLFDLKKRDLVCALP